MPLSTLCQCCRQGRVDPGILTDKVHLSVMGLSLLMRDVQAFLSPSCTRSDRPSYASAVKSGQQLQGRELQPGEQKRHQQVQRQGKLSQQPQQYGQREPEERRQPQSQEQPPQHYQCAPRPFQVSQFPWYNQYQQPILYPPMYYPPGYPTSLDHRQPPYAETHMAPDTVALI